MDHLHRTYQRLLCISIWSPLCDKKQKSISVATVFSHYSKYFLVVTEIAMSALSSTIHTLKNTVHTIIICITLDPYMVPIYPFWPLVSVYSLVSITDSGRKVTRWNFCLNLATSLPHVLIWQTSPILLAKFERIRRELHYLQQSFYEVQILHEDV